MLNDLYYTQLQAMFGAAPSGALAGYYPVPDNLILPNPQMQSVYDSIYQAGTPQYNGTPGSPMLNSIQQQGAGMMTDAYGLANTRYNEAAGNAYALQNQAQAYQNSVGQQMQSEYQRLGQMGENLYYDTRGQSADILNQGYNSIANAGAAGQAAAGNYFGQGMGAIGGAASGFQGTMGNIQGQQDAAVGYARGQIANSGSKIDQIAADLQGYYNPNTFEDEGRAYLAKATDPTLQLAAGKSYLENVVSDQLANKLTQGGYGGVRSGAYAESLGRAGEEIALPILQQVMANQQGAGVAGLNAGANLRGSQVAGAGVMTQGQAALLSAVTGLTGSQLAALASNLNAAGNVAGSQMSASANLAGAGMASAASMANAGMGANASITGAGLNNASSVYGTAAGALASQLATGQNAALGMVNANNNQYANSLNAALGFANAGNQTGALGMQGGQAMANLGTTAQGQQITNWQNALNAAQAPQNAALQQYLMPANLLASFFGGMPVTTGMNQNVAHRPVTSTEDDVMGYVGMVLQLAAMVGAACWVAEAIYGPWSKKTADARYYINYVWQGPVARVTRKLYRRHGRRVASLVLRRPWIGWALRPLFNIAARRGARARKGM